MAEEKKSSSSGPNGAVILLVLIFLLAAGGSLSGTNNTSSTATTSTSSTGTSSDDVIYGGGWGGSHISQTVVPTPSPTPSPRLSDREIEERLASLYRELNNLSEGLRSAKLREPASPYAGMVDLRIGNARDTDPAREYLTLYAEQKNKVDINISSWYLESYVTEDAVGIPRGDRTIEHWRSPKESDIFLAPGEEAYLLSDDSPIDTSFHENICTGYLLNEETFYPYLSQNCPSPLDEMKRFANIALDNDSCYDFVERVGRCEEVSEEKLDAADLTNSCTRFIENNLNYNDCVANHLHDPLFDTAGSWRIYLERDEDLWRYEREIIRLMDGNDRVIDVIEY